VAAGHCGATPQAPWTRGGDGRTLGCRCGAGWYDDGIGNQQRREGGPGMTRDPSSWRLDGWADDAERGVLRRRPSREAAHAAKPRA